MGNKPQYARLLTDINILTLSEMPYMPAELAVQIESQNRSLMVFAAVRLIKVCRIHFQQHHMM